MVSSEGGCECEAESDDGEVMVSYLYPFDDESNEKAPESPQGLDENGRVVIVVNA